ASDVDAADLRRASCEIQEVLAIRQQERRAMIVLARLKRRGNGGLAAGGRHARERASRVRCEQNHAVGLPHAAARDWSIGEDLNRLAPDVKSLQLALGKETDRLAVRRPEREAGAFAAWQRAAGRRIDGPQPQRLRLLR